MPNIRPATRNDLEAIASLHVSSWQSAYRGILPDPLLDGLDAGARLREWGSWLTEPEAHTYAAFEKRRLVGFARILPAAGPHHPPAASCEISHLYVAPDSQNMGVGQALLSRSFEDIVARGHERAVLWVLEKNYRARAFYERAGFKLDGARRTDPARLGGQTPEVRYQITISDVATEPRR